MTKKLWIICLFNSCGGGGYGSYYPSIWHPSIPYSNQFHYQKVRWWGYACHQCIQPHWKSWRKFGLLGYFQTSQKDVIKWTSFIWLDSFKPDFYTTNLQSCDTPLWRICAQEKILRMSVRAMHTFLKICIQRTYNVLCISDVLKQTTI